MILLYTNNSLSSIPFNYYGSLNLKKNDLTTIDGSVYYLYDSLKDVVDYSKSIALTNFKNNSEVFEEIKSNLTDISFVSYLKFGDYYLTYDNNTNSLTAKEFGSIDDLTENEFFEFILSGENFFIKKTLNTGDLLSSYFEEYIDEKYMIYTAGSYLSSVNVEISSYSVYRELPTNSEFQFRAILDHENNKVVIFKEGVGFLKFVNSELKLEDITSNINQNLIFDIIDLNNVINNQPLENSFFPLYRELDNNFQNKYSCNLQYLIPINEKSTTFEKNTNVVALKNHVTNTGLQSMAKYKEPFRKYNKVFNGDSGVDYEDIFLGFTSEIYSLDFPCDRVTYFHAPSKIKNYSQININDLNLVEDGSIGGDSPENSDKIFKKNYNYGKLNNTGNPSGLLNGQYLCSWLHYDPVNPQRSVWLDRYYSPKKVEKIDAMKIETYDALSRFYTEVGIEAFELSSYWESVRVGERIDSIVFGNSLSSEAFGILPQELVFGAISETFERVGVFDVKSSLTFEPESLYAYHHIGQKSSKEIIKKYDDNLVIEDFDQIYSKIEGGDKIYNLDGQNIYSKQLNYNLENSEFTITFDINIDNPNDVVAEMMIGNYSDGKGFGLFNNFTSTPFHFAYEDNVLNMFDYNYKLQSSLALGENIKNIIPTSPYTNNFVYGSDDNLYEISKGNSIVNKTNYSSNDVLTDTPYSMIVWDGLVNMLCKDGTIARYDTRDGEKSVYNTNIKYYNSETNSLTGSILTSGTHCLSITETHGIVVLQNTSKFERTSDDRLFLYYESDGKYLNTYPKSIIEYGKDVPIINFSEDGIVDFIINEDDKLYVLTYSGKLYSVNYLENKITASFVQTQFDSSDKKLQINNYIRNGKRFSYIEIVKSDENRVQRYNKELSKYYVLSASDIDKNSFSNFNSSRLFKYSSGTDRFNYKLSLINFYDKSDTIDVDIPILWEDLKQVTNKITLVMNNVTGYITLFLNDKRYYSKQLEKGKYFFNTDILDKNIFTGTTIYNGTSLDSIIESGAYYASGYSIKNFKIFDKAFSYYDVLDLVRSDFGNKQATLNMPISSRNYIEEVRSWFLQNKNFRKSEYVNVNVTTNHLTNSQKLELSSYIMNNLGVELGLNFRIANINFYNNPQPINVICESPNSNTERESLSSLTPPISSV